jgi:hypothetical protein
MDPEIIAVLALVVLVLVGVWVWIASRRRSERLQRRFGPEYDRTVETSGSRRSAESELVAREERRGKLDIRPLEPEKRDDFVRQWRDTQARFVDEPGPAVEEADRLVAEVMRARGYPVEDFEQREADISVDHASVVDNYRAAHGISLANRHGEANTEDLRQAMVHYRSLFEELLDSPSEGDHGQAVDLRQEETRRSSTG